MIRAASTTVGVLAVFGLMLALVGCQKAEDPEILQQRQKLLLDVKPEGALGVLAARQVATADPQPMVLVGRIGAGPSGTWDPRKAAFVVADLSCSPDEFAHEHSGEHDHCPFCQAQADKTAERTARIEVVDQTGRIIPVDARRLLAIQDHQTVVVRGVGRLDTLGNLVVAADAVFAGP
jgi:hypothetical protein